MQSAMNCQKKTYQFNNGTLSLRQVIGQVKLFEIYTVILTLLVTLLKTLIILYRDSMVLYWKAFWKVVIIKAKKLL